MMLVINPAKLIDDSISIEGVSNLSKSILTVPKITQVLHKNASKPRAKPA